MFLVGFEGQNVSHVPPNLENVIVSQHGDKFLDVSISCLFSPAQPTARPPPSLGTFAQASAGLSLSGSSPGGKARTSRFKLWVTCLSESNGEKSS